MVRLYHTTTEEKAGQILRGQRFLDGERPFQGRTGVWLASEPIDAQDEKVAGSTYLVVEVDMAPDDLESYDSGRCVEEIDGYGTFHVPASLINGRVTITMGGDVDELPSILDDMSDSEREAYFREQETADGSEDGSEVQDEDRG